MHNDQKLYFGKFGLYQSKHKSGKCARLIAVDTENERNVVTVTAHPDLAVLRRLTSRARKNWVKQHTGVRAICRRLTRGYGLQRPLKVDRSRQHQKLNCFPALKFSYAFRGLLNDKVALN